MDKKLYKDLSLRQRRLLDYLQSEGLDYSVCKIDWESVVYRKLTKYDFEISGGWYRRPFSVYVWPLTESGQAGGTVGYYKVKSDDAARAAAAIEQIVDVYQQVERGERSQPRRIDSLKWPEEAGPIIAGGDIPLSEAEQKWKDEQKEFLEKYFRELREKEDGYAN